MSGKLRIAGGVMLLGAAAAAGLLGWVAGQPGPPVLDSAALARAAQGAADGLTGELDGLRARARAAAALPPLRAALADGVDTATLVDLFATEDWWRSARTEAASRLVIGEAVAHHGSLELAQQDAEVVAVARQHGQAARVVAVGGRPVLLAGVRVEAAKAGEPVVVLGRVLEPSVLQRVAAHTGLALMLTDGRVPLAIAGPAPLRPFLESLVARQREVQARDPELRREAARISISGNVSLWAARVPLSAAGEAGNPVLYFAAATTLAVTGLVLLTLRGRRRGHLGDYPAESTLPFGSARPRGPALMGDGAPVIVSARSSARLRTPPAVRLPSLSGTAPQGAALALAPAPAELEPAVPHTTPEPMPAALLPRSRLERDQPSRDPLAAGAMLFGRYKILHRLGTGGMSEVYAAEAHGAEGFRRTFVIKRLRPELGRSKEAVAQFIDEARVQASLIHSNIVSVFDFGMMGGEYFMIEEYVLGRDLGRLSSRAVERTGFRLEPRLVYYFVHEVLHALAYAHSKRGPDGEPLGIVHRDVSASNIMVSAAGEVKLFDFGIAKANQRKSETQAGMVKGNANFMSPEQARGQPVDRRSDLFSLGLVMYYCLTNELLYAGDNDLDVIYRAATGPTAEDLERIGQLPGPARMVLERALAMNPADRYDDADEFAAALSPHLDLAGTGSSPKQVTKQVTTQMTTQMTAKAATAALVESLFGDDLRGEGV